MAEPPKTIEKSEEGKTTQKSGCVIPLGSNVQLIPPFVVWRIVPFSPTMIPLFDPLKETE